MKKGPKMARPRSAIRLLIYSSLTFGLGFLVFGYFDKHQDFNKEFQVNGINLNIFFKETGDKVKEVTHEVPGLHIEGVEKDEEHIMADVSLNVNERVKRINKLRKKKLAEQCLLSKVATNRSLFDYTHPRVRELIRIYQQSPGGKQGPAVPRLLVSDQHKALYCAIDGVAMDTWETVIMMLEQGYGKSLEDADQRFLTSDNLRPLWNYRAVAIDYRLKNYYKFIFVRNPIKRLLHTFQHRFPREKLQNKNSLESDNLSKENNENQPKDGDKPLSKFVAYLKGLPTTIRDFDAMTGSFSQLCMPCHIEYDFIGRTETMKDEFQFLLEKIGVNQKGFDISAVDRETMAELFENLTKAEREELYKMYKLDYSLFGYSYP